MPDPHSTTPTAYSTPPPFSSGSRYYGDDDIDEYEALLAQVRLTPPDERSEAEEDPLPLGLGLLVPPPLIRRKGTEIEDDSTASRRRPTGTTMIGGGGTGEDCMYEDTSSISTSSFYSIVDSPSTEDILCMTIEVCCIYCWCMCII